MAQSPYLDQNAPEILALERQKKLADLLQARALEQPQGQMVSGRFVAPSLVQQLAPLANAYMGRKAGEDVESRQSKLANLMRGQQSTEIKNILGAFEGGDQSKALELAATGQTPFSQTVAGEMVKKRLIGKEPKWEKAELPNPDGSTKVGYVNVNAPNPLTTFIEGGVKPPMTPYETATLKRKEFEWENLSAKDKATLANEGARLNMSAKEFFFNTGMSVGGAPSAPQATPQTQAPQVSPQGLSNALRGQPTQTPVMPQQPQMPPQMGQTNIQVPSNLPQKAVNELIKGKAEIDIINRDNAIKINDLAKQAEKLLPLGHGSGIGKAAGGLANIVGFPSEKNAVDAQLKVIGAGLTASVPRMQGPQSDKDVAMYKEAAGEVGNAGLPMNVRMAALQTVKNINKKYAPDLNWEKIEQSKQSTSQNKPPQGVDPKLLQFMTPEQKALFGIREQ
jgi:hypothetical protein